MPAQDTQTLVTELVATHGEQLRRFLLSRVRNAADVPDVAQEIYLRMLRVSNIESVRSPEAYLFTVAQHVVQQHALRQSAAPPSAVLAHVLNAHQGAGHADPALEAVAHERLQQLQVALDKLSPKARAAFMWSRRDGLSFEEIASRLGTSQAMAKKYVKKVLMQFRRKFEETEEKYPRGT